MERAGAEGTPVFLIGGKPEVLAQTEQKLRNQCNVNIVGSGMAISGRKIAGRYMSACATAGRNCHCRYGVAAPGKY